LGVIGFVFLSSLGPPFGILAAFLALFPFGPLKPSEFREPVRWGAWH